MQALTVRNMKTNFEKDIYEQPSVIRQIVNENGETINQLSQRLREIEPAFVLIAARGTSDNAAIYGKYLFSSNNRVPVGLAMPSLYTLYQQPPVMKSGLVIGISQSGQTPDVLSVLEEAKRQDVFCISITNEEDSPLAAIADQAIILKAGKEISVPASKTYTAQLATVAILSALWSGNQELIQDIQHLGDLAEEVLSQHDAVRVVAKRYSDKEHLAVVGRGINYCTTFEIALKIKELSYMVTQGYSAADFRHGPIAMLQESFPTVALATQGKAISDMAEMIAEIKQTGADLSIFSNDESLLLQSDLTVRLPANMPEWLAPIVTTIPGQLLALHLALEKGNDPDKPRALKKVTLTF